MRKFALSEGMPEFLLTDQPKPEYVGLHDEVAGKVTLYALSSHRHMVLPEDEVWRMFAGWSCTYDETVETPKDSRLVEVPQ